MKHIKYPKTEQFRNIVTTITNKTRFIGLDENEEPIFDESKELPIIKVNGTIKLHGTNSGISYNLNTGLYCQSRSIILNKTIFNHFGFTSFVNSNKTFFIDFICKLAQDNNIDLNINNITIFGEWCGTGIQKNVGISKLPKGFYFFAAKVSNQNDLEFNNYWLKIKDYRFDNENIFNINEFETFEITIDFNKPQDTQNLLLDLINKIEKECPVAKQLGVSGIGEGIVFEFNYKGDRYLFKSKGEAHSKNKPKRVKPINDSKMLLINNVSDKITPSWRLEQFFNEITDNGKNIERKFIGTYIKAILKDILEEDNDILVKNNLTIKDVRKNVTEICKDYFLMMERENFN